jgi:hypothetical protein
MVIFVLRMLAMEAGLVFSVLYSPMTMVNSATVLKDVTPPLV